MIFKIGGVIVFHTRKREEGAQFGDGVRESVLEREEEARFFSNFLPHFYHRRPMVW